VILDTAGRLHIDALLMEELKAIRSAVEPNEILLVADAMTGQEAVHVAEAFDEAVGERFDVAAAIEYAEFHDLPDIWVVGWSFGTDLTLMHANDPTVKGAVLLSPPLRFSDVEHLEAWAESGKPLTALVPEHDDYLQPPEAEERFAIVPQAEVVGVEGAKHLWVGDAETVLDEIVRRVAPTVDVPLPREWDGEMETADTSAYNEKNRGAFKDVPVPKPLRD